MSKITAIAKIDGGWQYTLDTAPTAGWDIWLDGARLKTEYSDTTYKLFVSDTRPPAIEVIDPTTDTPSHSAAGTVRISWQHYGARFYIIEYSTTGVTYYQIEVVPADGNIWHRYVATAQDTTGYYRISPAALDETGYYKTGYHVPCVVERAIMPKAPLVFCSVEDSKLHIELMRSVTGSVNSLVTSAYVTGNAEEGTTIINQMPPVSYDTTDGLLEGDPT